MTEEKKTAPDNKKIVTIDGAQYDYDSLTTEAKGLLNSIHLVDTEINRLQTLLGIARTARGAYAGALKAELDKVSQKE
jgi:hypothetical protein